MYDVLCQILTLIRQEIPIICLSCQSNEFDLPTCSTFRLTPRFVRFVAIIYTKHSAACVDCCEMIKRRRQILFAQISITLTVCKLVKASLNMGRRDLMDWGLRKFNEAFSSHINGIKFWMKFTLAFRFGQKCLYYVSQSERGSAENGNWVDNPHQQRRIAVDIYWITAGPRSIPFPTLQLALYRNYIN